MEASSGAPACGGQRSVSWQERQADYGQRWGEGAARCFSIEGDFLDEEQNLRLMPVPESFFCPISAAIMIDPVATVDGCAYERDYIERWFRERRQNHQVVTSPATGLELPSQTLMPLLALQRAIEAYLVHRPELRRDHLAGRSFEEAAQVLQVDLLEKQAMNACVRDELRTLRDANKTLLRSLRQTEATCASLVEELRKTRSCARALEDEKAAAMEASVEVRTCSDNEGSVSGGQFCGVGASPAFTTQGTAGARDGAAAVVVEAANGPLAPTHRSASPQTSQNSTSAVTALCGAVAAAFAAEKIGSIHKQRSTPPQRPARVAHPAAACVGSKLKGIRWRFWLPPWCFLSIHLALAVFGLFCSELAQSTLTTAETEAPTTTLEREPFEEASVMKISSTQAEVAIQAEFSRGCKRGRRVDADRLPTVPTASTSFRSQDADTRKSPEVRKQEALHMLAEAADGFEGNTNPTKISQLVRFLDDGDEEMQRLSAATLKTLATVGLDSQAAIARSGAILPLLRLLKSGSSARKEAAAALRNLAADNGRNQVAIAQAGAVAPLVKLLREDGSPGIQAEAAGALGNLAGDASDNHYEKQKSIARAGAIEPLVRLLDSDVPKVRKLTAVALRMLATNNADNQVAIARAGSIAPLVRLLEDDVAEMREEAALALGSLASYNAEAHYGNQVAIAEAGAFLPLVQLLGDQVRNVREAAAGALRELVTRNAGNQAAALEAKVVPALVKVLQETHTKSQKEAAGVLKNLAANNLSAQAAIVKAGTVPSLMALLQSDVPEVRKEAAATLLILAEHEDQVELIRDSLDPTVFHHVNRM